ncbi:3514_t:CDS:2, partial [Gigaspora rosea]
TSVWKYWTIFKRNLTKNQDYQAKNQVEDQAKKQGYESKNNKLHSRAPENAKTNSNTKHHVDEEEQKSLEFMLAQALFATGPDSSLKKLAINLLKIPILSTTAKQNFSTFGFIHSKLHNHLHNKRVKKLVYIYKNFYINVKIPVNNKIDTRTNVTNHENHENKEVENIIYEEGICRGIEETEQIYSTNVDNISTMKMELLNYY